MFDGQTNDYWTREASAAHAAITSMPLHPKGVIMALAAAAAANGIPKERIIAEFVRIAEATLTGQLFNVTIVGDDIRRDKT